MIHVINSRGIDIPNEINHVIVDRRSMLGNPFKMDKESERKAVCDLYEKWLTEQLAKGNKIATMIDSLVDIYKVYGELYLYCWCAPKKCHADSIKKAILNGCRYKKAQSGSA